MHVRHRQDPLVGTVLNHYRIEALIGEGAAARVYRARHVFLDRPSAVKLLSATSASTKGLRARFEREARALATISHPNVVSIFDFGFARDGRPFLTMELLSGRTLA
jgi:serine/threonine protein kinase